MDRSKRAIKKRNFLLLVAFVLAILFLFYSVGNASQSTLYKIDNPESVSGPSSNQSSSASYSVLSEIGDTAVSTSLSATYSVLHGVTYEDAGSVLLNIIAVPEKRVPLTGNDDSHVTIEVRSPGSLIPLFSQTVDTDINGEKTSIDLVGISPGVYDLTAKAYSHLRRKKINIALSDGVNAVDFSDAGTNKLLCGDVNLVDGDNKVNSLDVTILVDSWFTTNERTDLNQDGQVNSIDITNMITNFNRVGDE